MAIGPRWGRKRPDGIGIVAEVSEEKRREKECTEIIIAGCRMSSIDNVG